MPIAAGNVVLYGAVSGDYLKCLVAADVCGIARSKVTGEYASAWTAAASGHQLVIAVGGAALYALYYNECGWENPAGMVGGSTPFTLFPSGQGVDAVATSRIVNAAGFTALDSLKLAVMLAYYAVHGAFPSGWTDLPTQETPQKVCVNGSGPSAGLGTTGGRTMSPVPAVDSVGVYASFSSLAAITVALQQGWQGIAATSALGIPSRPYTRELSNAPDKLIAQALARGDGSVWWLSYWTVSWPAHGEPFYDAAYAAGQYAAQTLTNHGEKYVPTYVVVDPEGYNTPASTAAQWSDWIRGFAAGVIATNELLQPAFYCDQSQYQTYNLSAIALPAFVAVSPIAGNSPHVHGGNIAGYASYYATCPANVDRRQVVSWGGRMSTVQFRDSGVDCGP